MKYPIDTWLKVLEKISYKIGDGSGGGNRSSIRVPSKKRKNKWKNFKKLFPKYCEDNNL